MDKTKIKVGTLVLIYILAIAIMGIVYISINLEFFDSNKTFCQVIENRFESREAFLSSINNNVLIIVMLAINFLAIILVETVIKHKASIRVTLIMLLGASALFLTFEAGKQLKVNEYQSLECDFISHQLFKDFYNKLPNG